MADISNLTNLQATEPIDETQYADAQERRPSGIPNEGEYFFRAPEKIEFGATAAGFLSAKVDATIVGPSNAGFTIRYNSVSAKKFKRQEGEASQMGDYLRANGHHGPIPGNPQQLADLVEQTQGQVFRAATIWEAWDKIAGRAVKGQSKFPKDAEGNSQPWIVSPFGSKDPETGEPLVLRARLKIDRYIPA